MPRERIEVIGEIAAPQRTAGRPQSGDRVPAGGALRRAARALLQDPGLCGRAGISVALAGAVVEVAVVEDSIAQRWRSEGLMVDDALARRLALTCVAERCGVREAAVLVRERENLLHPGWRLTDAERLACDLEDAVRACEEQLAGAGTAPAAWTDGGYGATSGRPER